MKVTDVKQTTKQHSRWCGPSSMGLPASECSRFVTTQTLFKSGNQISWLGTVVGRGMVVGARGWYHCTACTALPSMHAPHSNLLSCFRYQLQSGCVTSIIGSCIWFRLELMLFLSISETSLVVRMYVVQCNNLLSCFRYRLQPGCLVSILTSDRVRCPALYACTTQ